MSKVFFFFFLNFSFPSGSSHPFSGPHSSLRGRPKAQPGVPGATPNNRDRGTLPSPFAIPWLYSVYFYLILSVILPPSLLPTHPPPAGLYFPTFPLSPYRIVV